MQFLRRLSVGWRRGSEARFKTKPMRSWIWVACGWAVLMGVGTDLEGQERREWTELKGPGFVILSDAPAREMESFALVYAAFYHAFQRLFEEDIARLPRSTLVLFASEGSFRDHLAVKSSFDGKTVGFSVEVDGAPVSAFSIAGARERALRIALEAEGMWATRRLGYFMPIWMTQGVGQVLSTMEIEAGGYRLAKDTRGFSARLKNTFWLPWSRFLDFHVRSKEYGDDGIYHSQAWGLMHWVLFKDDQGPQRFKQLAELLRTHSALEAVQEVMKEQPDHFKEVIEEHLRRSSKGWKIPFDHAAARKAWSVQPADAARVAVTRAELMRGAQRLAEAEVVFTQIRLTHPESPWVKEAAARKALREANEDEAVQFYREAISAGTENPAAYLVSAKERLDRSRAGGLDFAGQGNQRYVDEALEEIRHARALDPGNSAAYRLLGRAFYVSPTVNPSMVEELQHGVFSGPEGEEVRFYLALLCQRLGLDEAYVEHLSSVLESPQSSALLRERAKRIWTNDPFVGAIEQLQALADNQRFEEIRLQLEPEARMGSRLTLSQRAYLSNWLSEQEAIDELKRLYQEKRWDQFKLRAETFFKEHPKSPAVSGLQAYYERAVQQLRDSPR